jgi:hypothetical protein
MFVVGRLIGRVDIRLLLATGLGLTAWAMYDMTGWTPDVSQWTIISTGFVQGAGLGFLFVPLTTLTFATLPAEKRWHRPIQPLAQYRFDGRDLGGNRAADARWTRRARRNDHAAGDDHRLYR